MENSLKELIKKTQVPLSRKQRKYLRWKRAFDVLVSASALTVLFPILLGTALAVKLESPREKVLFLQQRIGRNNKEFRIYKFRSMKTNAPNALSTAEFMNADQYITKVGKFVRKTSIDELPQLINVLRGDMSLIGPRPLIKTEEEMHFLRHYYGVYQIRPGITGLAQVNGRDNMEDYTKVRWDRAYVRNISFRIDCAILVKTVQNVLFRKDVNDDNKLLHNSSDGLTQEEYDSAVREYKQHAQSFGIDTSEEFVSLEV